MIKTKRKIFTSIISVFIFSLMANCSNEQSERTNAQKKSNSEFTLKSSHDSVKTISWYGFEEGMKKAKSEKKYIFVDFYTEWCTYCKKLESETYTDEKVYKYLNDKFVPIKVNAESQNKVSFAGQKLTEQELAATFGVSSYPTLFFMNGEKDALGQIPGFVTADDLFMIANYVATNSYKTKSLDQYKNSFKS